MTLIEEIKETVSIEDCLEHFGVHVPARGRDPVMVRCPWHEDKSPSLAVYRKQGRAWCYSCNKGGDVVDCTALFMQRNIKDAVHYWADRLHLSPSRPTAEEAARAYQARMRRQMRDVCHVFSHVVEKDMPRPRDPSLLSAWDTAFQSKDAIDERAWRDGGPKNKAEAARCVVELKHWRETWETLLVEINGVLV
ncbi:MAG: CHC2 zinc finger domain-containing protein [Actinomycetota bacterium]